MTDMPERGGVTWFGDPLADGTFFAVHAKTRPAEFYAEMSLAFAKKNEYPITPELVREIQSRALEYEAKVMADIRARGIGGNIRKLLSATRKNDAVRWAEKMVLDATAFTDLIHNSGAVGLSHHARHQEFLPTGRELSAADSEALYASPAGAETPNNVVSKVQQIFVEREYRSAHLFADSRERWHLFLMTFADLAGDPVTGAHHWKCGSHVHYMSHLFNPRITKAAAWKALDERKHSLPCIHIRFRAPETRPDDGRRVMLNEASRRAAIVTTNFNVAAGAGVRPST